MAYKRISINWDISGFKYENIVDMIAFALNKNGQCKNKTGVIGNMQHSSLGIEYYAYSPIGSNDEIEKCIGININEESLPIYVKEIQIFAYMNNGNNKNAHFTDLDFFNVFVDNEKIYSKENNTLDASLFHIGNLVKTGEGWIFNQEDNLSLLKLSIVELGNKFGINFSYES